MYGNCHTRALRVSGRSGPYAKIWVAVGFRRKCSLEYIGHSLNSLKAVLQHACGAGQGVKRSALILRILHHSTTTSDMLRIEYVGDLWWLVQDFLHPP